MTVKLTIDSVRKEFEDKGFVLLTDAYKNSRQKFKFICTCGNEAEIRIDHMRAGVKCSNCAGNKKLTIEYVNEALVSEGYILLSDNYVNSKSKFKYKCPKGHIGSMSFNNWNTGVRCGICFGTHRYDFDVVKSAIESEGYRLSDTCYHNKKHKLNLVCPNGHGYSVSWESWFRAGSRCPKCKNWGTSEAEEELKNFILNFNLDLKTNDRCIIKPLELDFVIPSKKLAIEYCGLYWHSERMGKSMAYHLNKLNMCNAVGYKLITIFEDEWVSKRKAVKNKLTSMFNKEGLITVDIIDCKVCLISMDIVNDFYSKYSLNSSYNYSVGVGIFYNNILLGVGTFLDTSNGHWLITDMCRNAEYNIKDWKNIILSFFREHFFWNILNVDLNKCWYTGESFIELGFNHAGDVGPKTWYFKNNKKRYASFVTDKAKDNIIWDCGNTKLVKTRKRFTTSVGMPHV